MNFILGSLGAAITMLIFSAGMFVGWKLSNKLRDAERPAPPEQSADEKVMERMKEEQQAFRTMLGYNLDIAYGLDSTEPLSEFVSDGG